MSDLRLILLLLGIIVIVSIYLGDKIQKKRKQRHQTVSPSTRGKAGSNFKAALQSTMEEIHPSRLMDFKESLLGFISFNKREKESDEFSLRLNPDMSASEDEEFAIADDNGPDLFARSDPAIDQPENSISNNNHAPVVPERIITLHITTKFNRSFQGMDVLAAAEETGFQFGEMDIFHHHGVGVMRSERSLFSLVNMYEPGNFDPDKMEELSTRGLSLFCCLPAPIDAGLVFEFMLAIAKQLADLLDGDIRGEDHNIINEKYIDAVRNKISRLR